MRICLSIGAATTEEVRCIWKKWAEIVDIVEIRLDTMQDRSLTSLLLHRPGPVIVTNRRADEGGRFQGDERERVHLLITAAEQGADYIDLEEETPLPLLTEAMMAARGYHSKVILSWHEVKKTPGQKALQKRIKDMAALGPDIVKIVPYARRYEDNLTVLNLLSYGRRRAIPSLPLPWDRMGG